MSRTIKSRGKTVDEIRGGRWVYGSLVQLEGGGSFIVVGMSPSGILSYHEVDPATVGQFAEIRDCHGREIYECDICTTLEIRHGRIEEGMGPIAWKDHMWVVCNLGTTETMLCVFDGKDSEEIEIIGNIHDNPELMAVHS